MFQNVLYDNQYNRELSKKFLDYDFKSNKYYEPTKIKSSSLLIGGSRCGCPQYERKVGGAKRDYIISGPYDRSTKDMILPGTSANYPQYNSVEMMELDRMGSTNHISSIEGGNVFKKIGRTAKKALQSKEAKVLGKVLTKAASRGLDFAAPAVGSYVGSLVGQPVIGREIANAARKELKNQTGFGKMTKEQWSRAVKSGGGVKSGGVALYEGGGVKSGGMTGVRSGGSGLRSGGATDKRKQRGEMIKKVMKEKKMNLAQASKYIKDNKLL
jgi:hypothetical protein